jgi:hypothetical protein
VAAIRGGVVTLAEAADAFLSSPHAASPNTRCGCAGVLDRLAAEIGPHRPLAAVPGEKIAAALRRLWGNRAPARWNRNRAAVVSRAQQLMPVVGRSPGARHPRARRRHCAFTVSPTIG